jgi:hypothetical protein
MPWFLTRAFLFVYILRRKVKFLKKFHMKKIRFLLNQFNLQISQVEKQKLDYIEMAIKFHEIFKQFIPYFIDFETKYIFKSVEDEISYFNDIKPKFLSQFFYLKKIIEIESSFSFTNDKNVIIKNEIDKIMFFKQKHAEIIALNFENNTDHLSQFFNQTKCSSLVFDDYLFSLLHSTLIPKYDVITAYLIACQKIELYLFSIGKTQIMSIKEEIQIKLDESFTSREMVELAYALFHLKGGQSSSIKVLVEKLSFVFDVKPSKTYEIFNEIKQRAGSKTIFIDKLKHKLEEIILQSFSHSN